MSSVPLGLRSASVSDGAVPSDSPLLAIGGHPLPHLAGGSGRRLLRPDRCRCPTLPDREDSPRSSRDAVRGGHLRRLVDPVDKSTCGDGRVSGLSPDEMTNGPMQALTAWRRLGWNARSPASAFAARSSAAPAASQATAARASPVRARSRSARRKHALATATAAALASSAFFSPGMDGISLRMTWSWRARFGSRSLASSHGSS